MPPTEHGRNGVTDTPDATDSTAPATGHRLPQVDDFPTTGPNALAEFRQRAWARVIDELLTEIPFVILYFILVWLALANDPTLTPQSVSLSRATELWVLVAGVACALVYEVVAIAWRGQTLGKWLLGIRVASFTDGKRPSWSQSALRCLLPAVAGTAALVLVGVSAFGAVIVLASAWFTPLRRGWHDTAGGTIVVRTR